MKSGPARRRRAQGCDRRLSRSLFLQHGQQIKTYPKDLLKRVAFKVSRARRQPPVLRLGGHLQPDAAGDFGRVEEAQGRHAGDARPDVIAAGNIGCMMQIGSGTDIPIVHTVELLDWATGGPKPPALDAPGKREVPVPILR
jgi:glycolate oxidase iron-sulfur subunit